MPVTLATSEAKIRRISGQIVQEMLSRKTSHKNRASGVAQGEGPDFKKKKKVICGGSRNFTKLGRFRKLPAEMWVTFFSYFS
jgi:hypothetical protein